MYAKDGGWTEPEKIAHDDAEAGDLFGFSLAISGNIVVVGAPSYSRNGKSRIGAVFIYEKDGGSIVLRKQLLASDAISGDRFGYSVDIDGNNILVGAPEMYSRSGSAYVFSRINEIDWEYKEEKLVADDVADGDSIGLSVAISGGIIVVGAPYDNESGKSDAGSAHVFTKDNGKWIHRKKLVSDNARKNDKFGWSVAVYKDRVIVGAPHADDTYYNLLSIGAAYVFRKVGNYDWEMEEKIVPDGGRGNRVGYSIGLHGDTLVLGADGDDNMGAAYAYKWDVAKGWIKQKKLVASDRSVKDRFGHSVGVFGDTVIVGAPKGYDNRGSILGLGSAYFFSRYMRED